MDKCSFDHCLDFPLHASVVCLLSGKCTVCSVVAERPELFLAVYTWRGSSNVGQFTPARHRQVLPESMQHSNCCLKSEGRCPGQELVYNTSASTSSLNIYTLRLEQPRVIRCFCLGTWLSCQRGHLVTLTSSLPDFLN